MDKSIMKKLILALALLLAPSLAWGQCNGVFAVGTVCGSAAGGVPGPISQITIGGLIINTPISTTNQAIKTTQVVAGSITDTLNSFNITFDQGTTTGFSNGWAFAQQFGGGVTTGGRQTGLFELIQNAATNAANINRQYVALSSIVLANSGDGGGAGTELGFYYAFNPYTWLKAAATHVVQASSAEFDIEVDSGASVLEKYGLKISQVSADAVQGSSNDAAIAGINGSGAVGWKTFFQLGDGVTGRQPLVSTGKVFGAKTAQTVDGGFDLLTNFTCTTYCFRSNGFLVDGSGVVTGSAFKVGAAAGLSVTKTVRAAGGAGDCSLIFTSGLLTGGSC